MSTGEDSLALFHPRIATWFAEKVGVPTDIQQAAWPKIARREHVLVTAPTGSGKTLTAFLWALNQLVTGALPRGATSILYVSPLKALNNDIYRNLLSPLAQLREIFAQGGEPFADIHVQTRSGDTPQSDRRRMLRNPPEILITTPESLNILLSSTGGKSILANLTTVILDEIHAVLHTKRGTHLITAVERVARLAGEFQRIALSATIRPLDAVASFVGGFTLSGGAGERRYLPRKVAIIQSSTTKNYDLRISFPQHSRGESEYDGDFWHPLVSEFKNIIKNNRSTLFFVNNRRLSEKLTLRINHEEDKPVAYAHHGSLSREIRMEVERRMKAGELKAIVATNSLELGIDIGSLEEVVLVQCPPLLTSAIQRIGRAGHDVGRVSRGTLFPMHDHDLLEAAVAVSGIISQDIEPTHPAGCPLDVLAQVIVSMVGTETWDIDELYAQLCTSYPYRHLSRRQFDMVLNMLAGRYADTRVRELKPKISIDRLENTVVARRGALLALYLAGGMIPDRGYYHLRHHESGALIGELDEEFVWEAKIGQSFTLGTQHWKIQRITHNDVFVAEGSPKSLATPFWKGEGFNRDFHFSAKIAEFLEEANHRLDDGEFINQLRNEFHMDASAAHRLLTYLRTQRDETGCDLPHRRHLLIEQVQTGPGGVPGNQLILHTMWGGRVNRPYAMALEAAWDERFGQRLEVYAGNDCIILQLPHGISGEELLSLVTSGNAESLLRRRLERSGFFSARFRECAGRALLITRYKITERMPLWMSRLRSQKLLKAVQKFGDFPILLETWRSCLQDEFDLEAMRRMLAELESGVIHFSESRTGHPSPMARTMSFAQINQYMYAGDESVGGESPGIRSDLLTELVFTPGLRPTVSEEVARKFMGKRQRVAPGYSPSSARDLIDWAKERVVITEAEWQALLRAMRRDHGEEVDEWLEAAAQKLVRMTPPGCAGSLVAAAENVQEIKIGFYQGAEEVKIELLSGGGTPAQYHAHVKGAEKSDADELLPSLLGQWLQYYGPLTADVITATLGIQRERVLLTLEDLTDGQTLISGQLVSGNAEKEFCDSENFEVLLRLARADAVPDFTPLPADDLPLFIAAHQGLAGRKNGIDALYEVLEQLLCYPASAKLWEAEIFPARIQDYSASWLDSILQEGDLRWIGSGDQEIAFCYASDLDLLQEPAYGDDSGTGGVDDESAMSAERAPSDVTGLFPDVRAKYDFSTLMKVAASGAASLSDRLWGAVWQGSISNDGFQALRKGIQRQFKVPETVDAGGPSQVGGRQGQRSRPGRHSRPGGTRARFSRWKESLPYTGNWYIVNRPEVSDDAIELEERNKERVRLILDRYGIVCREFLARESAHFRWSTLFRTLRIMELSGEVLAGYFFHGLSGPQFISHRALRTVSRALPGDAIFWLNATDPASCCGLQVEGVKGILPRRLEGTHLVYRGKELVLVSERRGRELVINVAPDDPQIQEIVAPLRHLLYREFLPQRRLTVEVINGDAAARSPYADPLRTSFDLVLDYNHITLYKKSV